MSEFKSGKKIEITENIITLINTFTEMPSSITPKEMYDILVSEKKVKEYVNKSLGEISENYKKNVALKIIMNHLQILI